MKKMVKRITASVLAAATALTLGLTASADRTVTKPFRGTTGNKVRFNLTLNLKTVAGAMYQLDVTASQDDEPRPFPYPSIYIQGILYGNKNDGSNSSKSTTASNTDGAEVTVTRGTNVSSGTGYGYFLASGSAINGNVEGSTTI